MSSKKAALLASYGMLAATAIPHVKEVFEISNPYADLPQLRYHGGESNQRVKKTHLTNKQQKKRAAAKRAKKARKKNR